MSLFTLNVLDAKNTLATHAVKQGEVLVLQAQKEVNYQLVDNHTGFAPQNIITKRDGNDLVILLEDGDMQPDIIIKDYYTQKGSMVIGLHENGQLYAYVPQSGLTEESISVLAEEVMAAQALGGKELAAAFWHFNPWWLAGIAGVAGIAALAARGNGDAVASAKDTSAPGKPSIEGIMHQDIDGDGKADRTDMKVKLPADAKPGDKITIKDVAGNVVGEKTLTQADVSNGEVTVSTTPELANGQQYNVTLTDTAGNTSAPAILDPKDTASLTPADSTTVNSPADPVDVAKPVLTPSNDGSVAVKVPADADAKSVTVNVTDPVTGTSSPVTLEKQPNGSWTSSNPAVVPSIPAGSDTATIPANKVKDGSEVSATATDGKNTSTATPVTAKVGGDTPATTDDTAAPAKPVLTANDDGTVAVKVPADENAKSVTVNVTDPTTGTSTPVTLTKESDGSWTSSNPAVVPSIPKGSDTATIPANKVKDGSEVSATATDGKNTSTATPVAAKVGGDTPATTDDTAAPAKPVLTPNNDGSVAVKVPADADAKSVTVNVTDPVSGTSSPVTLEKQPNGSWTSSNPAVVPSIPAGSDTATIPANKVKDGSQVTATATDGTNTSTAEPVAAKVGGDTPATTDDTTAPAKPVLTANDDGTVAVKVPADENAKSVTVNVTDPTTGTSTPVTLTKESDGSWTSSNPAVVPSIPAGSDTATIPANKVKDGSQVTATATDGTNTSTAEPVTAKAGGDTPATTDDTTAPAKPVLTANDDGTVAVKVPADENAKSVTVNVTDPTTGTSTPVTLTKESDGSWTSSNPAVVPSIPAGSDTATIPANKVKDGSEVSATATDGKSTSTATPVTAKDGGDTPATTDDTTAPAKPVLTPNNDGSVAVKVPADADAKSVTVNVTDPVSGTSSPVTLEKQPNGSWTSSNPAVVPSIPAGSDTATIPANKVKDGSEVTATATDGTNTSTAEPVAAKVGGDTPATTDDTTAPAKPVLTPNNDGSVAVKVPADADAKSVTVNVTDPVSGTSSPVTLEKQPNGSWTSSNPAVVPSIPAGSDTATIPANKVKDGSEVSATATDGKNTSTATPVTAKDGGDTPATTDDTAAPAKPVLTANDDGTVAVKVPADENAKSVTVNVTDPVSGTSSPVTLEKQPNGSWTSSNPAVVPSIPAGSDTATIPANKVKDGSEVSATATDGKNTSTAEPVAAKAGGDTPATTDDTTAPAKPVLTANDDGTVAVKVPADENAKSVTVNVTDPTTGTSTPVTLTKESDGSWTSSNPAVVPSIPAGSDTATIPANKVKDGSEVSATATDGKSTSTATPVTAKVGGDTPATTDDTAAPAKPVLTANDDGTVAVKVPADENAKSVTVNVTDPTTGTSTPVTLTKESDGSWTSSNPAVVPSIPKGSDTATIPANKVKDGSQVTATATDGTNTSTAEPVAAKAGGDTPATTDDTAAPAKPVLTANDDGTVAVKVPADENAKSVTVNVTEPTTGTSTPVTLTKESDGSWTSSNPAVVPSIPAGSDTATIPANKVKDGSEVGATATDGKNTSTATPVTAKDGGDTPATTDDTAAPAKPVLTANDDGTVAVKVPADENAKSVTVNVTDPTTGTSTPVTLTKESDGSWTSSNPAVVPSIPAGSDTATIPANKVKDGSEVSATATDGKSTSTATPVTAKDGGDTPATTDDTTAPAKPVLTPNNDGSVAVKVPADADAKSVTVNVTDPVSGTSSPVTLEKQPNGSWTSSNPAVVPSIPAGSDTATIPANKVKDGSEVSATATDGKNTSTATPVTAKDGGDLVAPVEQPQPTDPVDEPIITEGAAPKIKPGADNDKMVIKYRDETGEFMHNEAHEKSIANSVERTITVTKKGDGTWEMKLAPDHVQTGNLVDGHTVKTVTNVQAGVRTEVSYIYDKNGNAVKEPIVFNPATGEVSFPASEVRGGSNIVTTVSRGADSLEKTTPVAIDNVDATDGQWNGATFNVANNNLEIDVDGARNLALEWTDKDGNTHYKYFHKTNPTGTQNTGIIDIDANKDGVQNARDGNLWYEYNPIHTGPATENYKRDEKGEFVPLTNHGFTNVPDGANSTFTIPLSELQEGSTVKAYKVNPVFTHRDVLAGESAPIVVPASTPDTSDSQEPKQADTPTVTPSETDGSVTVMPHTNNAAMSTVFKNELGQEQVVNTLKGRDGKWKINGYQPQGVTIDEDSGLLTIGQNAVQDGETVTATGLRIGVPDATATGVAGKDNLDTTYDNPTVLTMAAEVKNNIRWINNGNLDTGVSELEEYNAKNPQFTFDVTGNEGWDGTKYGRVIVNPINDSDKNYTNDVLSTNASLGSSQYLSLAGRQDRAVTWNFGKGDDVIVTGRDFGVADYDRETKGSGYYGKFIVNTGAHNDMIVVGASNSRVKLGLNEDGEVRAFFDTDVPPSYKVLDQVNNTSAGADGGRMTYATVNMEEGNDTLVVEGYAGRAAGEPAIEHSTINMGSGNDSLLVGAFKGRSEEHRGEVKKTTIDMGEGDDYFSMGGRLSESSIKGGAGFDTLSYSNDYSPFYYAHTTGFERVELDKSTLVVTYDHVRSANNAIEQPLRVVGTGTVNLFRHVSDDIQNPAVLKQGEAAQHFLADGDERFYDRYTDNGTDIYIQSGINVI